VKNASGSKYLFRPTQKQTETAMDADNETHARMHAKLQRTYTWQMMRATMPHVAMFA